MAVANHLAVTRWAGQIHGPKETRLSMEGRSVFASGDDIYSYGMHFCMASIMRNADGQTSFILVNGDRYSNTTSGHQSHVRSNLGSVQTLIVPFSALSAANVDRESIRPLEIQDDTWTVTYRRVSIDEMVRRERDGYGDVVSLPGTPIRWTVRDLRMGWQANQRIDCEPDGEGYVREPIFRHWLGEAVFEATVTETRERKPNRQEREQIDVWRAWRKRLSEALDTQKRTRIAGSIIVSVLMDAEPPLPEGLVAPPRGHTRLWDRDTWKIAFRLTRKAKFLSAFDHNEARTVYFLCELPETDAETVVEAFDALAPSVVKQAEAEDIEVLRQGDIFAIPCELPREMTNPAPYLRVQGGQHRCALLGTDHTVTEVLRPETGEVYARGVMRHEPDFREPDHAKIRLDGWHLITRNTVPRDT